MNLKQRALLDVLKILGLGIIAGSLITLAMDHFGMAIVGTIVGIAALIWLAKLAYDIRVGQLEWEADRVRRAIKDGR